MLHNTLRLKAVLACIRHAASGMLAMSIWLLALLLLSCSSSPIVSTPAPLPTVLSFIPLTDLHPQAERRISTLVYLLPEGQGASLHDALSFEQTSPASLTPADLRIWCDPGCAGQLAAGGVLTVVAQGVLDGPGAFGPQGAYRWQLKDARLLPQVAEETSIANLLQRISYYNKRLLRVQGIVLLSKDSALLLDQIGPGGMPTATTQQLKLRWLHPDQQLIQRLKLLPGTDIRSGSVQIEGYMSNAALVPLSVRIIVANP